MKAIKKINAFSAAKIVGILGLIGTLLLYIVLKLVGDAQAALLGLTDILLLVLLQGVTWFVGTFVIALLYNLLAKYIGGIKLDIADHEK
nr:hypothetical protein [Nanoarchaeum sp.]